MSYLIRLGIGDCGLAQSPIPNPQSPIPNKNFIIFSINSINNNYLKPKVINKNI